MEATAYPDFEETQVPHSNVDSAMKTALSFFLETHHYQQLHETLSSQWQACHSLTAAIQLIKAHGTDISPEEEQRLIALSARSEEAMIEALVELMPRNKPEQFEHFFLQLSFIASTTTRLRSALESGHPDLVEEALESAENVGVLPYLLKMAVAQAGQEVQTLDSEQDSWLKEMVQKLTDLIPVSELAMQTQKELTQAKSCIDHFQADSRNKSRSVLISMMENNDAAFLANVFRGYADFVKKERREREIREEYDAQLQGIMDKMVQIKAKSASHMRGLITSQANAKSEQLLKACFDAFKQEVEANKDMFRMSEEEKELAAQIEEYKASRSAKATAVMNRMAGQSATGLMALAFKALVMSWEEEKNARGVELQLAATKAKLVGLEKKQKAFAKGMLTTAFAQSSEQMVSVVFSTWKQWLREEKQECERQAAVAAKSSMVKKFRDQNKQSAMSAADRVAQLEDQQLLTFVLLTWKREAACERLKKMGKDKNDKRKKELAGVKGLFRSFANELETNLSKGTPRIDPQPKKLTGPDAE